MKTVTIEIENKVDELLAVLSIDVENIEKNLVRLNDLRSFVIKRDNNALEKLLSEVRLESGDYSENGSQRCLLRRQLAAAFGYSDKQITLTMLEGILSGDRRSQVSRMKTKIKTLAEELRKEYLRTSMFLSEFARFNSLLLNSILEMANAGACTYDSKGFTERRTDTAFMDMQF